MTLVKNLHDLAALISQAETPETGTQFNSRLKAALGQDEHLGKQAADGVMEAPTSTEPQVVYSDVAKSVTITIGDSEVAAHIIPERSQAVVGNLWAAQKGVGIGTRLMLALCDWCKAHGIKFITGSDVSPNGESAKIRQKLPGKSVLFRRKWDNDLNTPNGADIWPDAPEEMKKILWSITPDPTGNIMVTKLAAALRHASDYVEVWPSAWIDPQGEIHECETHEEFAGTRVGPAYRHYPQAGLLRQGWIRVGEYEGNCYAECWKWTTRTLTMVQHAFQSMPKLRGEIVTVDNGQPGSAADIPYDEFMAMNKPTEFRHYKFAAEGEHGPDLGENGAATDETGQFWGSAGAGVLFYAQDTGRVLFALRSDEVNEPGTYGVWGGAIDYKEDPLAAARREAREEAGYTGEIEFRKLYTYRKDGFTYTTFLGTVPHEFKPRLNWESADAVWAEPGEWPSPLHFGVKALLPALDAAVEPQGVEHLESARKKTASDDQQTMARYYDVVAQVIRDGADTFEKFLAGLRQALGSDYAQFLQDAAGNVGLRHLWSSVIEHDADDLENSLEHMRISPRKPTAVKSVEDPHGDERLQPSLDAMSRDEQTLAHNVAIMESYPGFSHLQGGPREKAEQIVKILSDNLIWLYNEWDEGLRNRSKLWYVGGNRVIHRWSKRFQMQPHQIAAVIAALSPQQDWFTNVTLAERLLSAIKEHADFPWDDAMTKVTTLQDSKGEPGWGSKIMKALGMTPEEAGKLMVGKTLREIMGTDNESLYKQAVWIRAWDQAHNPNGHRTLSPEGEFGDWDRKNDGTPIKNRWNSFGEITKAIKLAEAPDARLISDVVGENHKVRSFYNNLVAPMSKGGDVTIDTHAVAAALLRPLSAAHREVNHNFGMGIPGEVGPKSSKITGSTGLYGFYAEAYRRAADAVGVQPREMQSITWEAVRGLFKPHQKRNDAITKGTDQAWHDVSGGLHGPDEARNRILELVGGLDRPSWSKPHPGDPAGERDSSYTGELPSGGAPGRGRALPGGAGAGSARGVAAGVVASRGVTATNTQARLDRLAYLLFIPRSS